jgi:hypothetical protein
MAVSWHQSADFVTKIGTGWLCHGYGGSDDLLGER